MPFEKNADETEAAEGRIEFFFKFLNPEVEIKLFLGDLCPFNDLFRPGYHKNIRSLTPPDYTYLYLLANDHGSWTRGTPRRHSIL